jgi:hypothetical protein
MFPKNKNPGPALYPDPTPDPNLTFVSQVKIRTWVLYEKINF